MGGVTQTLVFYDDLKGLLVSSGLMSLQKQSFALTSPQMTEPSLNAADCVTLLQY